MGSHLIFIAALNVIPPQPDAPDPVMPILLAAMAVPAALMSLFLPKLLFRKAVQGKNVQMIETPDPEGLPGFGKMLRTPADPNGLLRSLLQPYSSRVLVGSALAESVSLLGFVLKFMGFGWGFAAPFFVVGITVCLLQRPSEARFRSEVEETLGMRLARN
jgi:hypothetical protein